MKKILALASILAVAGGALPAAADAIMNKPIYDPESKSYFELKKGVKGGRWENALKAAAQSQYKGTRGRLAMLTSAKTNQRVYQGLRLKELDYENIWIGIRFWCRHRKLMWSNGDIHPLRGYSNWTRPWYRRKDTNCPGWWGAHGYMPVTILPKTGRWQATGLHKGFQYYLVEYPTGKE